ncbi:MULTISPECIES: bacillibactin exporter BcbE [unclassified Bacillus (in: firmicutes)]|uniref:bacillibactin exporter BcbE n=1 Tax=unclassified Bacillus (in: firmicutes) TaxID=185979 RepID=UPI00227EFA08|nr:bacillibactin exporter BcbE [Bacillus sp. S20C3]MCY8202857.1 bacillibactin exporter BcbE [Bacillus sp. N12A5]MCY8287880.1 bacillibactin exporter BcbE [Bacillus sp. N13C7]MCY8639989.1 bacillibactin exporter BcbE [Bacillus sp. S17B2]MCY8718364.1 bacillibactin exporter BcbE [Bacillus sp. S10C12M]MCY9143019.1 bacillibactin exporter BcbE [Bacillus sp. T9C1]
MKTIIALSSVPLVMTLGNSMLIPVLPMMEKKLSVTSFQVSLIITVYSVVAIICIPIAGYLSDRFGRKKILLPCLIIAGLGGVVAAFASTYMKNPYAMILAGRVLQGIGSAGAAPIVMPFIGDLFEGDDEKVSAGLGDIETANTSGKVLSPILGALLASWYWFVPFWFIPFFCLVSFLLVLFLVPKPEEDEDAPAVSEFIKSVRKIFKQDGRWLYTVFIIGCVIMFLLFGVLFYLSDTLENKYAIDGVAKGGLLAIPLLFLSTSSFIAGKKIGKDKGRMKFCVVTGMIMLTLSFIALWWNHSFYLLFAFLSFGGIGIGMALPALDALITEGIESEQCGTISSFYNSMRFIGVALGPPVFAALMSNASWLIFILSAFCSIVSLFLVIFTVDAKKSEEEEKNLGTV